MVRSTVIGVLDLLLETNAVVCWTEACFVEAIFVP